MTDRELMQQALEALEEIALAGMSPAPEMIDSKEAFHARQAWRFIGIAARQLSAIREALAEQPAQHQEPVAYASDVEFDDETEIIPAEQKGKLGTAGLRIPLYIKPPARKPWVGLTDEEMHACWDSPLTPLGMKHARMIEAKLKEKNG